MEIFYTIPYGRGLTTLLLGPTELQFSGVLSGAPTTKDKSRTIIYIVYGLWIFAMTQFLILWPIGYGYVDNLD